MVAVLSPWQSCPWGLIHDGKWTALLVGRLGLRLGKAFKILWSSNTDDPVPDLRLLVSTLDAAWPLGAVYDRGLGRGLL